MELTLYAVVIFFLCHFIGDFWLQSDWMALNKNKKTWNCLVHVLIYTSVFLLITTSWKALLFIGVTHFIIDRWPFLLKRLIWWKNHFPLGEYPHWNYCNSTGYYDDSPYNTFKASGKIKEDMDRYWGTPRHFFITIWIYITIDNTLHLLCNLIALTLLI
jgi:hypothetical protein